MSAGHLPPLPEELARFTESEGQHRALKSFVREYGQACRVDLLELVRAVHRAKGRYHSQLAMCALYDACGLPNTRPEKTK